MRLFLLPGFGEEEWIFDKIKPHLPGDKVFLNPWSLIGNAPRAEINALHYAEELVARFDIRHSDVVIGHSTGGWVALHIKHLVNCPIVQVSSWTDKRKVIERGTNKKIAYWLTKKGLLFNTLTKHIQLWRSYRHKPSAPVFAAVFDRLINGNKDNVNNQLRLIFNSVHQKITAMPDLRIHARPDTVVTFPDEPFYEVPGDHFSLYTYPDKVYPPILALLQQHQLM